ncbi:MAG: nicotinate (nicotinamide) nucleotide adenylyltransferase [Oscillospiraceae bacterium]|nr:nicotinate (nicotinamide) nucleotide adenylyltransferase [Oscillospiraceae bacterium]MBQ4165886.1 nicotinate (nicotinamide) nucleotide adenylyltransferase [Oscillospiraceae bacterium]
MTKTGIFGGAFNPVHNGHVRLAEEAVKQLKLKKLLIIPTFDSPHKDTKLAPFEDRMEMCRLAFSHIEGAEVCDIERRLGGKSFTINTVRALRNELPDAQFYLLIGGDMLFYFDQWYKYESLLKETKVCAVARDNDSLVDMMEFANEMGRIKVLPTQAVEISSTEIREKLKSSADISGLVPKAAAEYIAAKKLYSEA